MRILALSLVLLSICSIHAQQWNWAVDAGGGGNTDFCFGIATDSQGNAYWVGSVSGTADFGCATIAPGTNIAGVLAKYDANGACQWARGMTTGFYEAWVYGIAIDAEDRIYITGSCKGNTDFGNGIVLSGSGSSDDWFTARYDADGTCIWAKRITNSSSTSEGRGIAIDDQGDVYVTGFAGGSGYTFDPVTVNTGGFARQAVIVKYDSDGTALWARSTNGAVGGRVGARSISVAGDRLFVTGQVYFAEASYDGLAITTVANTSAVYVLACDLDGEGLWTRSYGGGDHEGYGISADTLGNLFVVGRMWGTLNTPDGTLSSVSSNDDILLMGFDQDGNYRWAKSTGSAQRDLAWGVTADGMGNAYVAAHFHNTIDFFGTPLTALGSEDIVISKVEADGDVVWVQRPSGFQRDIPLCIHRQAIAPHTLYFGGYFWGAITYGNTTIDDELNGDAMMVAGIDTTFDVSLNAVLTCPGSCEGEALAFTNGDAPFTYTWSNGSTEAQLTGLCQGEVIIDVTDANGNTITDTVYVTESVDPNYTVNVLQDSLWMDGGTEWLWLHEGLAVSAGLPYHIAEVNGAYQAEYVDGNGCLWSTEVVIVVLNVGMEEEGRETPQLYPNPANDVVRMEGRSNGAIRTASAMDVLGRRVSLPVIDRNTLDVHHLAAGTWLIQFETGCGTEHARLVKE